MSDMSEIIKSTLDGMKEFADSEAVVGGMVSTPGGLTVIPISRITAGYIGAGADYGQKKISHQQSFGGGSGTGISITPIALLTVSPDFSVNLISINTQSKVENDRLSILLERSPEIIQRIKNILS